MKECVEDVADQVARALSAVLVCLAIAACDAVANARDLGPEDAVEQAGNPAYQLSSSLEGEASGCRRRR